MMLYQDSIEESHFSVVTSTEKQTFTNLIVEKSKIVPSEEQEGKVSIGSLVSEQMNDCDDEIMEMPLLGKTQRKGGLLKMTNNSNEKKTLVLVDMREFRSKLPSFLDEIGLSVWPVVLAVGDFILSSQICVERKSYYDLIDSFHSGRIFGQIEIMVRTYAQPLLLIEFDENQNFCLNEHTPDQVSANHIIAKVTQLTRSYPTLRILWSRSPRETAALFVNMKQGNPDPLIPLENEDSLSVQMDNSFEPIDVLKSMPGITSTNYMQIASQISNLKELFDFSLEQLESIIGKKNGLILYNFLNKAVDSGFAKKKNMKGSKYKK
jgi:DNA excision repair protein ERCC-4